MKQNKMALFYVVCSCERRSRLFQAGSTPSKWLSSNSLESPRLLLHLLGVHRHTGLHAPEDGGGAAKHALYQPSSVPNP